jgi:hypothetical protein|tara:strand:- start:1047 stop:1256 length:210 start_codon:yes stop_codon:yes gene_type:complete
MHGNLEPEENVFYNGKEYVNDLWEDMDRLNALYEEMMWPHDDVLEFVPDHKNSRIIIKNKSQEERNAEQ